MEIGALGAVEFNVTSVTLNDVAKGGAGGIVVGKGASGREVPRQVDDRPDDHRAVPGAAAAGATE